MEEECGLAEVDHPLGLPTVKEECSICWGDLQAELGFFKLKTTIFIKNSIED